jgi:hypothetical protein
MKVPSMDTKICEVNGAIGAIVDFFDMEINDIVVIPSPPVTTTTLDPKVESSSPSFPLPVDISTYGSMKQKSHLQRWLAYHCLPQSVADILRTLGVRTVDDVFLLISQKGVNDDVWNEMVSKLSLLDRIKLCDAAAAAVSAANSTNSNDSSGTTSSLSVVPTTLNLPEQQQNLDISSDDNDYSMCDCNSTSASTST